MLRVLGVPLAIAICIATAPWGFVVGVALSIVWLCAKPAPPPEKLGILNVKSRLLQAIPLLNAAYCADCDLITDTPHDACGVCGSHSVVGVSRMLQRSWLFTAAQSNGKSARYRLNLTAEVREIPADGLGDITKLITHLGESGGRVERLHINVEPSGSEVDKTEAAHRCRRAEMSRKGSSAESVPVRLKSRVQARSTTEGGVSRA